jgi:hypothetical protein
MRGAGVASSGIHCGCRTRAWPAAVLGRHDYHGAVTPAKPTDIDALYGLEPVIEPGDEAGSDALESIADITCPYCAEIFPTRIDVLAGDQSYVEDCQVCCQPIQIRVQVNDDGTLAGVDAERLDR